MLFPFEWSLNLQNPWLYHNTLRPPSLPLRCMCYHPGDLVIQHCK